MIDEIQKVPALLNEVHWLYENKGIHFALCGSSARKVTSEGVNLLGGRGIRYEMYGLSASELDDDFDLIRMLNNGYLPPHYISNKPERMLNAYISTYLKEEIAAEGLVRRLPAYSDFLSIA
ncbi:MAG: AAA family ATPase, partial [Bacteroidales bacterium]